MGIRKMLQERRLRKLMKAHVSPEAIQGAIRDAQYLEKRLESRHFQFVVIAIDESSVKEVPEIIRSLIGIVVEHGANLASVTSSIVLAVLGVPFQDSDSEEQRRRLVEAVMLTHRQRVKIAHGQCLGDVGLLGAGGRFTYTQIIPEYQGVLRSLIEASFGTAIEVS